MAAISDTNFNDPKMDVVLLMPIILECIQR